MSRLGTLPSSFAAGCLTGTVTGDDEHLITSIDDLLPRYGDIALGARTKEQDHLAPVYQEMIAASPFCVLATVGPDGTDCTPRGDEPGFVRIVDAHTLELPDRKGNNRLDSLRNIIEDGRISLLFLIPGRIDSTRVNGRAVITTDPDVLESHAIDGKAPATVIRITVERAYSHCGKAMIRSNLWNPEDWPPIEGLPTPGQISNSFKNFEMDVDAYDANYENDLRQNLL